MFAESLLLAITRLHAVFWLRDIAYRSKADNPSPRKINRCPLWSPLADRRPDTAMDRLQPEAMLKPYSQDLRERVIAAVKTGTGAYRRHSD